MNFHREHVNFYNSTETERQNISDPWRYLDMKDFLLLVLLVSLMMYIDHGCFLNFKYLDLSIKTMIGVGFLLVCHPISMVLAKVSKVLHVH